jgi:hypothetical protein
LPGRSQELSSCPSFVAAGRDRCDSPAYHLQGSIVLVGHSGAGLRRSGARRLESALTRSPLTAESYGQSAIEARSLGWPVLATYGVRHLAIATDAVAVTDALLGLERESTHRHGLVTAADRRNSRRAMAPGLTASRPPRRRRTSVDRPV